MNSWIENEWGEHLHKKNVGTGLWKMACECGEWNEMWNVFVKMG